MLLKIYSCSTVYYYPYCLERYPRLYYVLRKFPVYNPPIENLNDHEYHFNQHKNNLRQCDKKELSPCQFEVKSMESQMTEDFSKRKTTVEKILVSKDRSKSRWLRLWKPQSENQAAKLSTWARCRLRWKTYNRAHQVYHFHQNRWISPYDRCKVSKTKWISKGVD